MSEIESVARLSAEHLSCLVRLSETWLLRQDALETSQKLAVIMTADIEHVKALYQVMQLKIDPDKRAPFSRFLRRLADAEERQETVPKGGDRPA